MHATPTPITVTSLKMTDLEGPENLVRQFEGHEFTSRRYFDYALDLLRPATQNSGYNKVRARLELSDGEVYEFRIDVKGGFPKEDQFLFGHFRHSAKYFTRNGEQDWADAYNKAAACLEKY